MRKILLCFFLCFSFLWAASDTNKSTQREKIKQKAIQEAIKKEEKYAKEQAFYEEDEYDFKSQEVNEESLPYVPKLEPQDFNMENVYD